MQPIDIRSHKIGPGQPTFIIAEAGVNHNGSLDIARKLIDAAVDAGADAVKFQTFKAEQVVTAQAPKAEYQMKSTGSEESQLEMIKRLELSFESFASLQHYCQERGILFLSTPFDYESADFLEGLGVPLFKIPSGELTNLPFLQHMARMRRPLILSTGMAYLGEVETALRTIGNAGNPQVALLHCVSCYPTDPADVNLRAMQTLAAAFGLPVGFSDHTLGLEIALAAVALGAMVIEKHFTIDCNLAGPDHRASLEPSDLGQLVRAIRNVEAALGHGRKVPALNELSTSKVARRSLVAAQDIAVGVKLTLDSVVVLRPGTGLAPGMLDYVLGKTAKVEIPAGTLIDFGMLA